MRKTDLKLAGLLLLPVFLSLAQGAFSQSTFNQILSDAKQAYAAKDYATASQLYLEVVRNDPRNAEAFQALGNCEYAQGHKTAALAAFQHSLAIHPNNPQLAAFVEKMKSQLVDAQPAAASSTVSDHKRKKSNSFNYWGPEYDVSLGPVFGLGGTGIGVDETYYFMNAGVFALGVAGNVYIFGLGSSNLSYFAEGLLQCRVTIGDDAVRPFLIAGGGINTIYSTDAFYNNNSYSSFSFSTEPMAAGGAGVLFSMSQYFRLFLQAKASFVFMGGTKTTITSEGYSMTPVSGGTLIYFPIQFGCAFGF